MKPLYKPKGRAQEYCEWAVNIFTGCTHGCVYCFAAMMANRWGKKFSYDVEPRPGILEALEKQLAAEGPAKSYGRDVHLCFSCDPYPKGVNHIITREIIKLLKGSGHRVQILTKNGPGAVRDFDLLDSGDSFGVTIACNADQQPSLESGAPSIGERLEALKAAHDIGVKTWISFEPVYDPDIVFHLLQTTEYIDHVKIGKLNYYPSSIHWAKFGYVCEALCEERGLDYIIKNDLRREMAVWSG